MLQPYTTYTNGDPLNYKPTWFPTNLKGWWSALDPLNNGTLPVDSSTLSSWVDKSANANNFSQGSLGIMPTFKRTAGVNSHPAVLFSGTQYMTASVVGSLANSITLLVQSASPATQVAIYNGNILSSNGYGYVYDNTGSPAQRGILDGSGGGFVKDDGNATSNFEVITIGWDGTNSHLRVNGTEETLTSPTTAPILPTTTLFLGVDNPDPSYSDYMIGYVCEIIIRNSWNLSNVLSDEQYINRAYGL